MDATTKSYCHSTSGELFYGHHATEQAAADACMHDNALEPGHEFYIGVSTSHTAHDFVDAYNIMEECIVSAGDMCGEAAEDWLVELQRDKDALAELQKLVGDFLQAREPVKFFSVEHTRTWRVADDDTAVLAGEA